ncbi:putative bromo adjacent homology domain, zinc finger, RING/FYVE/PHD-type containing protein [Tanacetum coccineum]
MASSCSSSNVTHTPVLDKLFVVSGETEIPKVMKIFFEQQIDEEGLDGKYLVKKIADVKDSLKRMRKAIREMESKNLPEWLCAKELKGTFADKHMTLPIPLACLHRTMHPLADDNALSNLLSQNGIKLECNQENDMRRDEEDVEWWVGDKLSEADGKTYYRSCCINGTTYQLQHYALFSSTGKNLVPGKLQEMWEDSKTNKKWVTVTRYFFPDDLLERVCHPCAPESNEIIVTGLKKLEALNINCCNCITDVDMKPLSELTNLKELQISCSKVTNHDITFLKGLHKLALLNMERCPITLAFCIPLCWKFEVLPFLMQSSSL